MIAVGVATDAARRLALTHGLPSTYVVDTPALSDAEARELVTWALLERLDGLLAAAVAEGRVRVSQAVAVQTAETHLDRLRAALECEATAVHVVSVLSAAGVPCWLLKGLAVAHLDHADPAWRSFVDADVLVPRTRWPVAIAALQRAGYRRVEPAPRPRWEQQFARSVVLRSPDGVEVDLHVAVCVGWFGEVLDHQRLVAAGADGFMLGGVRCQGLSAPARFLMSCYHAELSRGPGLRYVRDLVQQLVVTECDWRAAVVLAGHGRGDVVVARAVRRAVQAGALDPQHPAALWAADVQPSALAARALQFATAGVQEGWRADARSTMLALSPTRRVQFLAGVAWPSAEVRHAQQYSLTERWRRAVRFTRVAR